MRAKRSEQVKRTLAGSLRSQRAHLSLRGGGRNPLIAGRWPLLMLLAVDGLVVAFNRLVSMAHLFSTVKVEGVINARIDAMERVLLRVFYACVRVRA